MTASSRVWRCVPLLVIALLAACAGLEGEEEIPVSPVDPSDPVVDLVAPTPPFQADPSPTPVGWLADLASGGSTQEAPEQVFFLNGPDVALINPDLTVADVTEGERIRMVASAPDGSRAAAVYLTDAGSREAEEIRLLDPRGDPGEPIFGPEVVSGSASNPRITGLQWAPDGASLALSRDDGSVWIVAADGASEPRQALDAGLASDVAWSAGSGALAVLIRDGEGEPGRIQIVQTGGPESVMIEPVHSYGAFAWLHGSGRLVVAEEWLDRPNPLAGSLFVIEPGGSAPELLVSGGEFAPRAAIPMLSASPDGRWLAFPVLGPGPNAELRFLSLWLLEMESGLLRQVPVPRAYQVSDLWWSRAGLIWRGVEPGESLAYTGVEPFAIGLFDLEAGGSRIIYESGGS